MPRSFIKSRGPRVINRIFTGGVTDAEIPTALFPHKEKSITNASAFYAVFTMTSTSATLASASEDVITASGCTLRLSQNVKPNMGAAVLFAATAQRKPGTTGAIAAQSIVFSVNSVEIGRFSVPLTPAGLDPTCGYVVFYNSTGDTRVNLDAHPLAIASTATDSDMEIVVWIVGNQD